VAECGARAQTVHQSRMEAEKGAAGRARRGALDERVLPDHKARAAAGARAGGRPGGARRARRRRQAQHGLRGLWYQVPAPPGRRQCVCARAAAAGRWEHRARLL